MQIHAARWYSLGYIPVVSVHGQRHPLQPGLGFSLPTWFWFWYDTAQDLVGVLRARGCCVHALYKHFSVGLISGWDSQLITSAGSLLQSTTVLGMFVSVMQVSSDQIA